MGVAGMGRGMTAHRIMTHLGPLPSTSSVRLPGGPGSSPDTDSALGAATWQRHMCASWQRGEATYRPLWAAKPLAIEDLTSQVATVLLNPPTSSL